MHEQTAVTGAGAYIGRYRLLGLIGHGGMADVHLALSTGIASVRKLVAVKRLRPEHRHDPEFAAMFFDEARLAARVSHPNVVQAYEVGEDDGLPFITMEYLDGQPLHHVLQRLGDRLSVGARLQLLIELLAGLHHAHELCDYDGTPLHVVHRDVNPQNVFVTYEGHVKLVDFGIAKARDSFAQTRMGMFKGKLAYMAPEQVRGEDVDRRSDVFAVGIMLAECVSGRRVWQRVNELEIANRLAAGEVPWPLPGDGVPASLSSITARALAPTRDQRYESADALRAALIAEIALRDDVATHAEVGQLIADAFAEERARTAGLIEGGVRAQSSATAMTLLGPTSRPEDLTRRIPAPADPVGSVTAARTRRRAWPVALAVGVVISAVLWWTTLRSVDEAADLIAVFGELPRVSPRADVPGALVRLSGDIDADATLRSDTSYLLEFDTFVAPGATLTIEPGTTILGDPETRGTLIVRPGGRLIAAGTRARPIIFTSARAPAERRPGDWGGVLLLGRAPINLHDARGGALQGQVEGVSERARYGGDDPEDDSGVLSWVRIEYGGVAIGPNNEINGLTLAGVGRGTRIDHVAVTHTADDCFEFFGGTVDATHLACVAPGDDAFDWDLGYRGRLQFLLAAQFSDEPGSHGFEGDNDPKGTSAEPRSSPTIFNVTLCGPTTERTGERYGVLARHGTAAAIHDAVVIGFDAGLDVRGVGTGLELGHALFARQRVGAIAYAEQAGSTDAVLEDDDEGFDERRAFTDGVVTDPASAPSCTEVTAAALAPMHHEHAIAPPDDGFFDPTAAYLGAVRDGEDDWLDCRWLAL